MMSDRETQVKSAVLSALEVLSTVKIVDAGDGLEKFQLYVNDKMAFESDPMSIDDFIRTASEPKN